MLKRQTVLMAVLAAAVSALALGPQAFAKNGDILVRGSCTGPSAAKLKLSEENGRIEVELEVDQNRNGVAWTVVLERNGSRVAKLTRTTRAPSGSFEARRVVANGAGADVIRAKATRTGESCTAKATFPA